MKRIFAIALLVAFFSACTTLLAAQTSFALTGTIVTARGIVDGTIIVADGFIQSVGPDVSVPAGVPLVKVDGIIFPGLIDLHNHLVWNVLPRWKLPAPVNNRYEWQAMPEYAKRLSNPEREMMEKGEGCDMERYAEIKALLGGATAVAGSFRSEENDPAPNACVRGVIRKLDFFSGLNPPRVTTEPLRYEIFPMEIGWQQAQTIRDKLGAREIKSVLFHLAEGKDASAKREFRMFRAQGFLRPGASIIHGVALGETEFREMTANGVGLIWSPRSNFELYGQTTDVESAKAAQVTMALAPDWSPTGSSGVLDELRYAYRWNANRNADRTRPVFTNAEFLQMVTTNPARMAAISDKIGNLAPGLAADLIVLPRQGTDPLQALVGSKPAGIQLAVVGGRAVLGDPDLMRQLHSGQELEIITVCNQRKALDVREQTGGDSFSAIEGRLGSALQSVGSSLAPLAECN
jgi:cytosine/adenosine deaminase-related metal-dependent hydrolase